MITYFDNCDVIINGSGIIAESASFDSSNSLIPIYSVGKVGIAGQVPNGPLKSSFSFSYIVETDNEPNYQLSQMIKTLNDLGGYYGVPIVLAGITGSNCYLESYSLRATVNEMTKATVRFSTFLPVLGDFATKTETINYDQNNNISHGWTTYVTNLGNYLNSPTYQFNYSFDVSWEPNFIIGNKYPVSVKLSSAHEKMTFLKDYYRDLQYSGEFINDRFINLSDGDTTVDLFNVSYMCNASCGGLSFDMSNTKVTSERVNVGLNDFAKNEIQVEKYY